MLSVLRAGRDLPQKDLLTLIFVRNSANPEAMVRPEGLGQFMKFSYLTGTSTHDLPACSIATQSYK
jgi:hypothetical protein